MVPKWKPNYWFWSKKANKFSWVIAVSTTEQNRIYAQSDIKAFIFFVSFIYDTLANLYAENLNENIRIALVFDNLK